MKSVSFVKDLVAVKQLVVRGNDMLISSYVSIYNLWVFMLCSFPFLFYKVDSALFLDHLTSKLTLNSHYTLS